MDLLQRFEQNWHKKNFVANRQQVLLAVSGGVDSMVMADLFLKSGIPFAIAHCNFKLRAGDADLDEALVKDWANENQITFHNVSFDTGKKAEDWKKGIQETARILRYEWLDIIREENNYAAIATAHHANDNVETLLINLFKGTGVAGLHAIPEKNNAIIRPLLFADKAMINTFAATNDIVYRDDVSNASDKYLRNAVRHHIVPAAEQWFPNVVQHVNDSIGRFAQAEIIYKRAIEVEISKLAEKRGQDIYVPIIKLQKRTPLETLCYELFTPYGFTAAQVAEIIKLFSSESGHYIQSPSHRIIKDRNFLIITANQTTATDKILVEGFPCTINTERYQFHFSIVPKPSKLSASSNIALIDIKRITLPLILRKWHTGDYFYPLGMGMKKKKLSKFFIDQKVPLHEKEQAWVLECDKRIGWIAGMRLDERFKVKESTEQVLQVEVRPH